MAELFDLGFPVHSPNLGRIGAMVAELGNRYDQLTDTAMFEPLQQIKQSSDTYSSLIRKAQNTSYKAVVGAVDHLNLLAQRAITRPVEFLSALQLQPIHTPEIYQPEGQPPSSIPVLRPPPQPLQPIPPPIIQPTNGQPPQQTGCITNTQALQLAQLNIPPGDPSAGYGGWVVLSPDGCTYCASPPVDLSLLQQFTSAGWFIVRGDMYNNQVQVVIANLEAAGVTLSPNCGGPAQPPQTPPTVPPTQPPLPQPPQPSPAVSCVTSADQGWSMDQCSNPDIDAAYQAVGIDASQMYDGGDVPAWWDFVAGQYQGQLIEEQVASLGGGQ